MDVRSPVMSDTSLYLDQLVALLYAVNSANLKWVKALLEDGAVANTFFELYVFQYMPVDTDPVKEGGNPLTAAINSLHSKSQCSSNIMIEIFDALLDSMADVNKPCPRTYRTPIMFAAALGNIRCVEKLIYKGGALHTADKFGDTVWTLAARAGNVDVLKYLIEDHGIDKNSVLAFCTLQLEVVISKLCVVC